MHHTQPHSHYQQPLQTSHVSSPQVFAAPHYGMQSGFAPGFAEQGVGGQAPYHYSTAPADNGYSEQAPAVGVGSWFDFSNHHYLKGFLIGVAGTLLLTNPTVQKTLIRGAVKIWSSIQGGIEEVKEQFQDIKAEMSQEE